MSIFRDLPFWEDAAERALKTAAQFAIWTILGTGVSSALDSPVDAFTIQWMAVLGAGIGGIVMSLFTSIISRPFGTRGTASMLSSVFNRTTPEAISGMTTPNPDTAEAGRA